MDLSSLRQRLSSHLNNFFLRNGHGYVDVKNLQGQVKDAASRLSSAGLITEDISREIKAAVANLHTVPSLSGDSSNPSDLSALGFRGQELAAAVVVAFREDQPLCFVRDLVLLQIVEFIGVANRGSGVVRYPSSAIGHLGSIAKRLVLEGADYPGFEDLTILNQQWLEDVEGQSDVAVVHQSLIGSEVSSRIPKSHFVALSQVLNFVSSEYWRTKVLGNGSEEAANHLLSVYVHRPYLFCPFSDSSLTLEEAARTYAVLRKLSQSDDPCVRRASSMIMLAAIGFWKLPAVQDFRWSQDDNLSPGLLSPEGRFLRAHPANGLRRGHDDEGEELVLGQSEFTLQFPDSIIDRLATDGPALDGGDLFKVTHEDRSAIKSVLRDIRRHSVSRCTIERLSMATPLAAYHVSRDPRMASLVCGSLLGSAAGPLAYFSTNEAEVQACFDAVCRIFGFDVSEQNVSGSPQVGSEYGLRRDLILQIVSSANQDTIGRVGRKSPAQYLSRASEVIRHTVKMFLAATGSRGTHRLGDLTVAGINLRMKLAAIGDKAELPMQYFRIVALGNTTTEQLLLLLSEYQRLVNVLPITKEYASLRRAIYDALSGDGPIFLRLDPNAQSQRINAAWVRGCLPDDLPVNIFRHRLASQWVDSGGRVDDLYSQLGHVHLGDVAQADPYSFAEMRGFVERAGKVIDSILLEDGWKLTKRSPRVKEFKLELPFVRLNNLWSRHNEAIRGVMRARGRYSFSENEKTAISKEIDELVTHHQNKGDVISLRQLAAELAVKVNLELEPRILEVVERLIRRRLRRELGTAIRFTDVPIRVNRSRPPLVTPQVVEAQLLLDQLRERALPVIQSGALNGKAVSFSLRTLLVLALWQPATDETELRRIFEGVSLIRVSPESSAALLLCDELDPAIWISRNAALLLGGMELSDKALSWREALDELIAFSRDIKLQRAKDALKRMIHCLQLAALVFMPPVVWTRLMKKRDGLELGGRQVAALMHDLVRAELGELENESPRPRFSRAQCCDELQRFEANALRVIDLHVSGNRRNYVAIKSELAGWSLDDQALKTSRDLLFSLLADDANKLTGKRLSRKVVTDYFQTGNGVLTELADWGGEVTRTALLRFYSERCRNAEDSRFRDVAEACIRLHDVIRQGVEMDSVGYDELRSSAGKIERGWVSPLVLLPAEYKAVAAELDRKATEEQDGKVAVLFLDLNLIAALEYYCGLRKSEAQWLQRRDLFLVEGRLDCIAVRPNRDRSTKGNNYRVVSASRLPKAVQDELAARWQERLEDPADRLFPAFAALFGDGHERADRLLIEAYKAASGEQKTGHYALRHCFATRSAIAILLKAAPRAGLGHVADWTDISAYTEMEAAVALSSEMGHRYKDRSTAAETYIHACWPGLWYRDCEFERQVLITFAKEPSTMETYASRKEAKLSSRHEARMDFLVQHVYQPVPAPVKRDLVWWDGTSELNSSVISLSLVTKYLKELVDGAGWQAASRLLPLGRNDVIELLNSAVPQFQQIPALVMHDEVIKSLFQACSEDPDPLCLVGRSEHRRPNWKYVVEWAEELDANLDSSTLLRAIERIGVPLQRAILAASWGIEIVPVATSAEAEQWADFFEAGGRVGTISERRGWVDQWTGDAMKVRGWSSLTSHLDYDLNVKKAKGRGWFLWSLKNQVDVLPHGKLIRCLAVLYVFLLINRRRGSAPDELQSVKSTKQLEDT